MCHITECLKSSENKKERQCEEEKRGSVKWQKNQKGKSGSERQKTLDVSKAEVISD